MSRFAKLAFAAVGCALIAVQFVPAPAHRDGGAGTAVAAKVVDPEVGRILDRSCQDCHSGNTRYPWYSRIAPVSWLVARDVERGRAKLDFAGWTQRLPSTNERLEICDAVSDGSMPLKAYALVHRRARLSSQDVDRICAWANSKTLANDVRRIDKRTPK